MRLTRILGIDPGSRLTGYGIVDLMGNQLIHVTHGTLKLSNTHGKAVVPLERRLLSIHEGLSQVIEQFKPQCMAIERVFFAKNAVSALKLGQARGAAILSGAIHSLEIFEYSATEVKATVTGHGQADKDQVAKMLQMVLGKQEFATSDASDGLALAVCHAYQMASARTAAQSFRQVQTTKAKSSKKRLSLAEACGVDSSFDRSPSKLVRPKS